MTLRQINCWHDRTFDIDPACTAFLAIDMQRDFLFGKDGQPNDLARIVPGLMKLTAVMRDWGCEVIHTRESYSADLSDVTAHKASQNYVCRPGPFGKYLVRGEHGCDFVDELEPATAERVIDQPGFGKLHGSGLQDVLQGKGIIPDPISQNLCAHFRIPMDMMVQG